MRRTRFQFPGLPLALPGHELHFTGERHARLLRDLHVHRPRFLCLNSTPEQRHGQQQSFHALQHH
ncbi:hypothetical protein [Deinococcus wulumuqiensis]|uniref:hypothetical protein n=1 Tax=Deinococcus wulumuqiensis TaxID=980427 RepID=UPI0013C31829|nr:hypothetical protein [Deinococcus wulumuqiensis]